MSLKLCPTCKKQKIDRGSKQCISCFTKTRNQNVTTEEVVKFVRNRSTAGGVTVQQIASTLHISESRALSLLKQAKKDGRSLYAFGEKWLLQAPASGRAVDYPLVSDAAGWHKFGAIGDTHLGSKHERLNELKDFYRIIEANEISTVLHSGNYIDGEARFNRHELRVHGMDAQLAHMGAEYPQIPGVTTYLVSGDDHEGWYAQREGVDIGFYMESVMMRGGRKDLRNLGYMECFLPLKHKKTGATSMVHVVHPGGGSAYAVSYTMQKQIEAYEGGEKPAIVCAGHYHKAEHLEMRNVHGFQTGCFQDQTVFMRKKKLIATIGGWIIFARQNPETGAVEEVFSYFKGYYNRGYYVNNRWSLSGPVSLVPRIKL